MRPACASRPFYQEHEGKRYCVLHLPRNDKVEAFNKALKAKLDAKDFNFRGVWFPDEALFTDFHFGSDADFTGATFTGRAEFHLAQFDKEATFTSAEFRKAALFDRVKFHANANFQYSRFGDATDFSNTTFGADARFTDANFKWKAYYTNSTFCGWGFFSEVTFEGEAYFNNATFRARALLDHVRFNAEATFAGTVFEGKATFDVAAFNAHAELSHCSFLGETEFLATTFAAGATFVSAVFRGDVNFSSSKFLRGAYFRGAIFDRDVYFGAAVFEEAADFVAAFFGDRLRFDGFERPSFGASQSPLDVDFHNVRIEKPEHVSFRNLTLYPRWFTNVDSRRFEFANVEWVGTISQEITVLMQKKVIHPHKVLSLTCRQLAVNAEENKRYEEASIFRYWSMDLRRRERFYGFAMWSLNWWYWALSGYGERVSRAFAVLIGVWLIFACLYSHLGFAPVAPTFPGPSKERAIELYGGVKPLPLSQAVIYSLEVITLQKPDSRPATQRSEMLVTLESIGGPLQAALLALAVRRKFIG
jgi:hypothetical protein